MLKNFLDKKTAMAIAQEEVENNVGLTTTGLWKENSKVVEAFPIFLDGIEDVPYWECKVTTEGKDAGYVLVNANKTDLLIPESAMEGITLTEAYRKKFNHDDFKVIRYDWLRNIAVTSGDDLSRSQRPKETILAAMGFKAAEDDVESTARAPTEPQVNMEMIKNYRSVIRKRGSFPMYSEELMDIYYQEGQTEPADEVSDTVRSYRHINDELDHTFTCRPWHTVPWYQISTPDGHAIGCGNTAWAILYAYWKQFKGKSSLFDGHNVDTTACNAVQIAGCMRDCARYCDTYYRRFGEEGINWPRKMQDGIRYAASKDRI